MKIKAVNSKTHLTKSILIFSVLCLQTTYSWAVIEKFTPYAFTRVLYDSNVFRLAGDQEAIALLGSKSRDDTISHLGAGVDLDYKISRQHIVFNGLLDKASYDDFSDLDHTSILGKINWKWQVGNNWSGGLGFNYKKQLSSFTQFSTPAKDLRTEKVTFFSAGYSFHPDWRLLGSVDLSNVSYQQRDRLDRDGRSGLLELRYKNTLNTRVGLRARYTENDLKNREDINGFLVNNDNDELEISGVFYWQGSSKSSFEARLGYTSVSYDELNDRDFNDSTGRLTYDWALTGKTNVEFSLWRETSTESDEVTNEILTSGLSITPTWALTSKIRLIGLIQFENDDFKAENNLTDLSGNENREDDTMKYQITAKWSPRQFLNMSLSYTLEERDSDIDSNDFDDNQLDLNIKFILP